MRFGTRPGPRTASISLKISATRPDAAFGSTSAIRAIDVAPLSGRPLEGTVVGVLPGVIPAPAMAPVIPSAADGGGHHTTGHVLDIGDPDFGGAVDTGRGFHLEVEDSGDLDPPPEPGRGIGDRDDRGRAPLADDRGDARHGAPHPAEEDRCQGTLLLLGGGRREIRGHLPAPLRHPTRNVDGKEYGGAVV